MDGCARVSTLDTGGRGSLGINGESCGGNDARAGTWEHSTLMSFHLFWTACDQHAAFHSRRKVQLGRASVAGVAGVVRPDGVWRAASLVARHEERPSAAGGSLLQCGGHRCTAGGSPLHRGGHRCTAGVAAALAGDHRCTRHSRPSPLRLLHSRRSPLHSPDSPRQTRRGRCCNIRHSRLAHLVQPRRSPVLILAATLQSHPTRSYADKTSTCKANIRDR